MQKIPGTSAFAINPTYRDGPASPHGAGEGWTDVGRLTVPTGDPTGGAPIANYPGRYAQIGGSASTPGGQPLDFSPSIPSGGGGSGWGSIFPILGNAGSGSSGAAGGSGSGGSTDPISTVADAFMAALGGGGAATSGGAPTILYPSAQVDDSTGGGGMNVKTIAIAAIIIVAAWYAWKKWGKPAASS